MGKNVFCLVAACLIAGGCSTVGTSSRSTSREAGLSLSSSASNSGDSSFRRQVRNDPFPAADDVHTADMRVRVKQ